MKYSWKTTFQNPPSQFRAKPFWAFNGKLEEAELRRQLGVFKDMGLGGAFLHARVGLATAYLSKEWFKLVKACVDESKKLGLEAWLYDEDRWPSGAAGGLVTKDKRFRMQELFVEVHEAGDWKKALKPGDILQGLFSARVKGDEAWEVRLLDSREAGSVPQGRQVLVFFSRLWTPSPWFNNQAYLDTMSPKAVDRFIQVTHAAYARNVGRDFGRLVPGIFTDEPASTYHWFQPGSGKTAWTPKLSDAFLKRHGYDLMPRLPEIFFKVDGRDYSQVRRDFRDTVTHLFVQSFSKRIGQWCQRHGLAFTGHVLNEETLISQTMHVGAAMRFYEFMQAPGIDILCAQGLRRGAGYHLEYSTAKQCASVARQFGRTWVLSELYGCTGWQTTLAEYKAMGDWQAALGVTLRVPHLSYYTMAGEAKRDYPASIHFQSPWWKEWAALEDYFSRIGSLLTRGKAVTDVAMIHPIESAWALGYGNLHNPALNSLEKRWLKTQNGLLAGHWDFDYLDEDLLARHGKVRQGRLVMGQGSYRAVVVPLTATLRESTRRLLDKLVKDGGEVIPGGSGMERSLEKIPGLRRVSVRQPGQNGQNAHVLVQLRHDAATGNSVVFLCHRQDRSSGPLEIEIPFKGRVQEWDPATGETRQVKSIAGPKSTRLRTGLEPYGSRLFVIEAGPASAAKPVSLAKVRKVQFLRQASYAIELDEPNAFPLDRPAFRLGLKGAWQKPLEVLRLDRLVRDRLGFQHRGGGMCQPWADKSVKSRKKTALELRYAFDVREMPVTACHLVMEDPAKWQVRLNGYVLRHDPGEGWWIDTSFKRIRVEPGMLRLGRNQLELSTVYDARSGLEASYFTGAFGMHWENRCAVVTRLPRTLRLGDWRRQGLACYSGSVTYTMEADLRLKPGARVCLQVPKFEGTLLKARANQGGWKVLGWPPFEADLTTDLRPGRNRLQVQVVSSRRNLLGPLHQKEVYPLWTGPDAFITEGKNWTEDYVSVPYGLMAAPVLRIKC